MNVEYLNSKNSKFHLIIKRCALSSQSNEYNAVVTAFFLLKIAIRSLLTDFFM